MRGEITWDADQWTWVFIIGNFSADAGAQRIVETLAAAATDTERAGFAEFM